VVGGGSGPGGGRWAEALSGFVGVLVVAWLVETKVCDIVTVWKLEPAPLHVWCLAQNVEAQSALPFGHKVGEVIIPKESIHALGIHPHLAAKQSLSAPTHPILY
jgi:hypothetical protein